MVFVLSISNFKGGGGLRKMVWRIGERFGLGSRFGF